MQTTRWRWLAALVLAFGAMTVAACGGDEEQWAGDMAKTAGSRAVKPAAAGAMLNELQDKGDMTVGVKFDVPPFGFKDTSGKVQDFDIELVQAVADALGVTSSSLA